MTVKQLISQLKKLPPNATIYKDVAIGGCSECNPEAIDHLVDVDEISHKLVGDWPNQDKFNIIIF